MNPAVFHAEAEEELNEAVAYYEARVAGLGNDLRMEIEHAVWQIRETPERWQRHTERTRRFLVRRFPYSVVYLIQPDHLWIIAVAHHKRRPRYWENRL